MSAPADPASAEVVRYEPRLLGEVIRLQTRGWSPDLGLNERYFHWKHEANPCLAGPEAYVALHAGTAVAMRGFVGSLWESAAGAAPMPLPMASDAVVAEDWENSGIMRSVMKLALDELERRGFPCAINLTASPVTLLGSLAAGWRATPPLGAMKTHAREPMVCRLRARLRRMPGLWRLADSRIVEADVERRPFGRADRHGPQELRRLSASLEFGAEPDIAGMTRLIGRLGHDGRLRQVRDERWLRWRYANPLASYRFLYCRGSQLQGYMVFQKSRSRHADRLRVTIMDCEAADVGVMELLLRGMRLLLRDQPVIAWRRALPDALAPLLEPAGFQPHVPAGALSRQRPCMLVKMLGAAATGSERLAGRDPIDLASWSLRRLYAD